MKTPPKEAYFVTGRKNRLYMHAGHVKTGLNHGYGDFEVHRVSFDPLDHHFGLWIDVTEEFK